jgi:hypothetical protein
MNRSNCYTTMKLSLVRALRVLFVLITLAKVAPGGSRLEYKFRGPAEWTLKSGLVVKIVYNPRQDTIITAGANTLRKIPYPDVIGQVIASDDSESLLFLIQERKSLGYDYSHLLSMRENKNGGIEFALYLSRDLEPMRKNRWVVELGAVSNDGKRALIKMGEPDREIAPFTVGHVWETWDLSTPSLLKIGLKLCE